MKSLLRAQPVSVWAVALAAVVSFMGLGLVDPILPAIAQSLHASHSDVELLFTSYFACTGISMLFSSVVASRIGAKRTLLGGLALIIVFSALAGLSNSVGAIAGLRAGWGFGNALFIATALSVIVGAASGGVAGAVMIYEAALGFGISLGPLLGGELGGISWRGPFFGVSALMAGAFVCIAALLPRTPAAGTPVSVLEPLRALRHRATRGSALIAVFYNFGFFTLLAYSPFVLGLGIHQLGYVFTGWGLLLAIFAVFVAPRVGRRLTDAGGLGVAFGGLTAILAVMGVFHGSQAVLIVCVIVSGSFLGITNTLMTQVVMQSAPVARPIASSAYSFVRFLGGAIAPFVAGKLAEYVSMQAPFYLGAGMTAVALVLLRVYRRALVPLEEIDEVGAPAEPAEARRRVLIAVSGDRAQVIAAMAAPVTLAQAAEAHLLHVIRSSVVAGEAIVSLETDQQARDSVSAGLEQLRSLGVPAAGEVAHVTGSHAEVAQSIMRRAEELGAGTIVLGPGSEREYDNGVIGEIAGHARANVVVLHPASGPLGARTPRIDAALAAAAQGSTLDP